MNDSILNLDSLNITNPFCRESFFKLLEESNVVGNNSGWSPIYFYLKNKSNEIDAFSYAFIKSHSFGEFIFDWSWANLFENYNQPYYPKLLHALPFTPVNAPKLIVDKDLNPQIQYQQKLIDKIILFYKQDNKLTGHHLLFTNELENQYFLSEGYFLQKTLQYHWHNSWVSFDDFLSSLKSRKRKQIKKERASIKNSDISIKMKIGTNLTNFERQQIYSLYQSTINKKNSYAYLNSKFFQLAPEYFHDNLVVFFAYKLDRIIAMSLFIKSSSALYGRYWGILPEFEKDYLNLHFELCYYQGMELCFDENIPLFEAGAQGEHKLVRGFTPTLITSMHHLKNPVFHQVIAQHIQSQNQAIEQKIEALKAYLPYNNQFIPY